MLVGVAACGGTSHAARPLPSEDEAGTPGLDAAPEMNTSDASRALSTSLNDAGPDAGAAVVDATAAEPVLGDAGARAKDKVTSGN